MHKNMRKASCQFQNTITIKAIIDLKIHTEQDKKYKIFAY